MNIELIREFVVLAEELSFVKAAERLFISRSTLSKHLQSMESELGVELFYRNNQRVSLTEAGADFADNAGSIIQTFDEAVRSAKAAASKKADTIKVGYLFESASGLVSKACRQFSAERDCGVALCSLEVNVIREGVVKDTLDLGITVAIPDMVGDEYSYIVLMEDTCGLLVSKDHPLATRDALTVEDLEGMTIHGPDASFLPEHARAFQEYIKRSKNTASIVFDVCDIGSLQPLISMGAEALFTLGHIKDHAGENTSFIPIVDFGFETGLCVIWKKRSERDELLFFIGCIQKAFEETIAQ